MLRGGYALSLPSYPLPTTVPGSISPSPLYPDAQGELAPFYQQAKEQEGLDADFQPRGSGHQPAPAFDAAATPCGEVGGPIRLNGSSGLVADGYQGQFPAGTRCVWVAPPLRGAQLHLSLHLVDLPPRPSTQGEGESRGTCGPDADSLRIRVLRGDDLAAAAAHSREANNGGDSDLSAPRAAEGQAAPLASPSRIEHRLCHGSRIPPSIALPRGAGVELSLSASLQSPGTAQLVAWVSVQHPLARQEFVERVSGEPAAVPLTHSCWCVEASSHAHVALQRHPCARWCPRARPSRGSVGWRFAVTRREAVPRPPAVAVSAQPSARRSTD